MAARVVRARVARVTAAMATGASNLPLLAERVVTERGATFSL